MYLITEDTLNLKTVLSLTSTPDNIIPGITEKN